MPDIPAVGRGEPAAAGPEGDDAVEKLVATIRSNRVPAHVRTSHSLDTLVRSLDRLAAGRATGGLGELVRELVLENELTNARLLVAGQRLAAQAAIVDSEDEAATDADRFLLEPMRGLVALDNGARFWRAVDRDPQFAFGDLCRYAGSWVELTIGLAVEEQPAGNPALYLDFGNGMSDASMIELPHPSIDTGLSSVIVAIPPGLRNARFDPCSAAVNFTMTPMQVRRLTKWQAMRRMARVLRGTGRFEELRRKFLPLWTSMRSVEGRNQLKGAYVHAYLVTLHNRSSDYGEWIRMFEMAPGAYPLLAAKRASWDRQPTISVIMPTYNTPARFLREAIESVLQQDYPHWELCIADDASTAAHVPRLLQEFATLDPRIKVVLRPTNGHISAASNSALELATGEFVALLDHDDRLHPLALHYVAENIVKNPSVELVFSDEDKLDSGGRRTTPYFKCSFNYELFLAQNMVSHLGCFRTETVRALGGFRMGLEGSQDWDLAMRVVERVGASRTFHIPRVLYHWRELPGSTAISSNEKPYAQQAGRRAVADHLARTGVDARVEAAPGMPSWNRVRFALPGVLPKVSIVIPTRDRIDVLKTCIDSLLERTTYADVEIIVVDNGSVETDSIDYLAALPADRVTVLRDDAPFNYSRLNNRAVRHASGELVCLLNNDIEALNPDWLDEMVSLVSRPSVGIVGARLLYPDRRVQHAGVVLGLGGVAGHPHRLIAGDAVGYFGRAALMQQFSAVTAACLLIRRSLWDALGGLDEELQVAFNDIDLCLRAGQLGFRTVWTPYAELIHHESLSRGADDTPEKIARFASEKDMMRARWGDSLLRDPFYSPNLTLRESDFSLSWDPRLE